MAKTLVVESNPSSVKQMAQAILAPLRRLENLPPAELIEKIAHEIETRYPHLKEPANAKLMGKVVYEVVWSLPESSLKSRDEWSQLFERLIRILAVNGVSIDVRKSNGTLFRGRNRLITFTKLNSGVLKMVRFLRLISGTEHFYAIFNELSVQHGLYRNPETRNILLEIYVRSYLKDYLNEEAIDSRLRGVPLEKFFEAGFEARRDELLSEIYADHAIESDLFMSNCRESDLPTRLGKIVLALGHRAHIKNGASGSAARVKEALGQELSEFLGLLSMQATPRVVSPRRKIVFDQAA